MGLGEVIQSHTVAFYDMVDPVALACRLPSLTAYDRDQILCFNKSSGRHYGIQKLIQVIIGKVKWPELYEALMKENLTALARMLEDNFYRQNPCAQPIRQDENLNPGVDQCEHDPTDTKLDTDTVCSNASSSTTTTVSVDEIVRSGTTVVTIHAQTVNFQFGSNNYMNTISNVEHDDTAAETACQEQYVVCEQSDVSKSLDETESHENMLISSSHDFVVYRRLSSEQAMPQSVSPQCSSSSSNSHDGSSPNVHSPNETADHTSLTLISQVRNGDEMVNSDPSENISSCDNTNTTSENHGLDENGDVKIREELGIALRTRVKRCGEGDEEEETELKRLA